MTPDKAELIQALIRLVIEKADTSRGNFGKGYYLLNYNHPIVWELYQRYRSARGLPDDIPVGDKDRLDFELSLFNVGMIKEIAAWCGREQGEPDKTKDFERGVDI